MKPTGSRRRARQRRALPYSGPDSPAGPRTLLCVDLRAVEQAFTQRPLDEVRFASRGGRLGALFSGMDVDPRKPVLHNARTLSPQRARDLFDALCEELAETVLHDVPESVWRSLLPLLAPQGSGECPYPKESPLPQGDALPGGLVVLTEGAVCAESAAVACSHAVAPLPDPVTDATMDALNDAAPDANNDDLADRADPAHPAGLVAQQRKRPAVDPLLWADILSAVLPMLAAVRDKNRVLLIEA